MISTNNLIICIGAGLSQVPYIRELKKRGYSVISTDKNPNSPGFLISDNYIIASTYDFENTPKLLFNKIGSLDKIKGIIAPCTGPPYRTFQKVRNFFGMSSLNFSKLNLLLDKLEFRRYCNSFSFSHIEEFNNRETLRSDCFPLIKKPRLGGMGSKGIEIFFSLNDYQKIYNSNKIDQSFIYEKFVDGREIAIDAIWNGTEIIFLNIGWKLFDTNLDVIIGSTSQNDSILSSLESQIKNIITQFCRSTIEGPEVLNIDMILNKDNSLHIIELEFVPSDGVILSKEAFGYDLVKNYISTHLNEKIECQPTRKRNTAIIFSIENYKQFVGKMNYEFFEISPFKIQTAIGQKLVNGYFLFSDKKPENLIKLIVSTSQSISLVRYKNV